MADKKNRRILPPTNKYQDKIMIVTFIPAATILLILVISLLLVRREFIQDINLGHQVSYISELMLWNFRWHNYVIFGICAIFVSSVITAFVISKNMVESFPRIISELDNVIELRSKKLITARPTDELSNELLKRINVLIKFYIENKK